jgi:hypothetical protein
MGSISTQGPGVNGWMFGLARLIPASTQTSDVCRYNMFEKHFVALYLRMTAMYRNKWYRGNKCVEGNQVSVSSARREVSYYQPVSILSVSSKVF